MPTPLPEITVLPARGEVTAVLLVLHGGQVRSRRRASRFRPAYLRMLPFAKAVHAGAADKGVAVWLLRYRYRGWNAPDEDPVPDARWALERIRATHPGVPVVLVGHSMGGRVALRVADDPAVIGACLLAPWTEKDEPVESVVGRTIVIAHGTRDITTSPRRSHQFAVRAKELTDQVARFELAGEGHAMLRRAGDWTWLVRGFVLGVLGIEPYKPAVANALRMPSPEGLQVALSVT
jgi:pimeloyl-ACP methyl ester carboxylesterase